MTTEKQTASPSDYLAAERTFLAWMRTGLAFMGFGFVVARFGLFLQQLQAAQPHLPVQSYGLSLWFGTGLIALGVLVNLLSLWHHLRLVRELQRGGTAFNRPSFLGITFATLLAIVGIAMAVYLISIRRHGRVNFQPTPEALMESQPGNGIISKLSNHPLNDTVSISVSESFHYITVHEYNVPSNPVPALGMHLQRCQHAELPRNTAACITGENT